MRIYRVKDLNMDLCFFLFWLRFYVVDEDQIGITNIIRGYIIFKLGRAVDAGKIRY